MKPAIPTNNSDIMNYLNSKNAFNFPQKTAYSAYAKQFNFPTTSSTNLNINSPKNLYMPTKPVNELSKSNIINTQKIEAYNIKEKSLKDSQILQMQTSAQSGTPKYTQKSKIQIDEKKNTSDKSMPRSASQEYTQTMNNITKQQQQQFYKQNEGTILKDNNRVELDAFNRAKKLEISTDVMSNYNAFKYPSSIKVGPSSTKNLDNEKSSENTTKNLQPYSSLEFMSKFKSNKPTNNITASTNTTENSPLYSTTITQGYLNEIQDDKQNQYQQKQSQTLPKKPSNILNKFFSQVDQPKSLSPSKKKADELALTQNTPTPKHGLKMNNFFPSNSFTNNMSASGEIKKNDKIINKTSRLETDISKPTNFDEESNKKGMNKSQSEIKNALKSSIIDMQNYTNKVVNNNGYQPGFTRLNTYENTKTDNSDLRSSQQFNTKNIQNTEPIRSSSQNPSTQTHHANLNTLHNQAVYNAYQNMYSSSNNNNPNTNNNTNQIFSQVRNMNQKEDDSSTTSQSASNNKASLNNFITKVNKGDIFNGKVQENFMKKLQNGTNTTTSPNVANLNQNQSEASLASKKPPLNIDDKLLTKTPKSNSNPGLVNKPLSRSTTNAESQAFVFGNNAKNQGQTQTQQNQDSSDRKPAKYPNKPLTPNGKLINSQTSNIRDESSPQRGTQSQIYYISSLEKYHRFPEEKDYFAQIYREHFIQTYQAMAFCKFLKPVDPRVLTQKKVMLNKRESHKDKKTIVFDLDETLIHCNESLDIPYDVKLPIKFPHGEIIEAGINIRPYALECLKELSQYFEIIVFTASHGCYANVVLDYLDPKQQYVHHRLFRESCVQTEEGIYIKDLRVLANRNLSDMVIVDNAAYSFGYQLDNGIPIIPYYDNKSDQELKMLVPYLKYLNNMRDIREANKSTFKLHMYSLYDTPEKVIEKVILMKN